MDRFCVWNDIEMVRELLGVTMDELAKEIGVSRMTLNLWKREAARISYANLAAFYGFTFRKGIRLNKIKEQFYREDYGDEVHKILFHGAKRSIEGKLDIEKSKRNNDLGQGFYCGESLEQSAMFVANYPDSSLYILNFQTEGLKARTLGVNREWMLLIAYFRGRLREFEKSSVINELKEYAKDIDYIIAPIADNRMFEIIDSFINGEITDVQCQHCLSATNLGNQYVFLTQKALAQVEILEHCYLAEEEKKYYLQTRKESSELNRDKVKLARRQYRGQGQYIEEILL